MIKKTTFRFSHQWELSRKLSILLLALCLGLPLFAGNSVFSFYGMPYLYDGVDIYSMGMGDAGSSDIFRFNTGYANPAQHNLSNRTLFSTGILMGYTKYQSETPAKQSYRDNSLDFPFFSLSVPLRSHRVGFQFNSLKSGVLTNTIKITGDELSVTERHGMDRYMYRADLIYSYHLKNLLFGISGNYYFGHDIHRFAQEGGYGTFNTLEKLSNSYKNPTGTFGAIYKGERFAIGAYYTKGLVLKGEQIRSSIHETEPAIDFEYEIPDHINAAITIVPIPNYKIALDYDLEPWAQIDDSFVNSWKISLGLAREPKRDSYRAKLSDLPIRTGVSLRKLPFKAVDDNEINEFNASIGVSVPLKKEINRLDFGFKYTRRGALETNKLQDDALMMLIGFTGFDIMSKALDRKAPRFIPEAEEVIR